jgi:hypothetical protein
MKRVFFGFVWFLILWFGTAMVGGMVVGGIAGSQVKAGSASEGFEKGQAAGHQAGVEFGRKYGSMIVLGALVVSIGGTVAGILPGTRPKQPPTS